MVEQVWSGPDIYRIPVRLPNNPLRNLNSYVICTPEYNLVIDTGFHRPECRADLWAGLDELRLDMTRTALFLTHFHSDHAGLVWDFVERGVPVYMGGIDHQYYVAYRNGNERVMDALFLSEGFPPAVLTEKKQNSRAHNYAPRDGFPVIELENGADLPMGALEIRALHVPGHTPGNMVLYLPKQQLLFSGDHILFDITPNISVWPEVDNPLSDYIASLQKIRALPIRAAFPAHREAGPDVKARIDQLIDHHGWRLDEIYRAAAGRPGSTAYEIAGQITWSAHGLGWEQFPPHQKWFATAETLAHLSYLADKGQLTRETDGGLFRYYPAQERLASGA